MGGFSAGNVEGGTVAEDNVATAINSETGAEVDGADDGEPLLGVVVDSDDGIAIIANEVVVTVDDGEVAAIPLIAVRVDIRHFQGRADGDVFGGHGERVGTLRARQCAGAGGVSLEYDACRRAIAQRKADGGVLGRVERAVVHHALVIAVDCCVDILAAGDGVAVGLVGAVAHGAVAVVAVDDGASLVVTNDSTIILTARDCHINDKAVLDGALIVVTHNAASTCTARETCIGQDDVFHGTTQVPANETSATGA